MFVVFCRRSHFVLKLSSKTRRIWGENDYFEQQLSSLVSPFSSGRRSSKHFLPHSCSFLKLPLFDASVPSVDDCIQRWLWRYRTRSVQCFAVVAFISCSLAIPLDFGRRCVRYSFTLRRYCRVLFPQLKRHPIRPVIPPKVLSSSEISRPSSSSPGCQLAG